MRRFARTAVAVIVVVVILVASAGALLVWRARQGPIPLDFLVPRLAAALMSGSDGLQVGMGGLALVWNGEKRHLELHARALRVGQGDGASLELESVRLLLRRRALLRGSIVVTAVEIVGPTLHLVRTADGQVALKLQRGSGEEESLGRLSSTVERLRHVAVRRGRIVFVDEPNGTTWTASAVDGDAWREGDALRLQVELALETGRGSMPTWIDATYRAEAGTLELQATAPGAPTDDVLAAWPASMASEAHAWVTRHVKGGRVADLALSLAGHVEGERLAVDRLRATLDFDGLSVRYLDPMPVVTGVQGRATFSKTGVEFAVAGGTLEALAVGPAMVRITWPEGAPNRIAIDADVHGPLASAVAVLDHEPVALGERLRFQSRGISGTATVHLGLAFPLGAPHPGRLGLRAHAKLTQAAVPYLWSDWDVRDGECLVRVTDTAVALDGTATVRGVPAALRYRERFGQQSAQRLVVAGRLDRPQRHELGLEVGTWLQGPVDVTLRLAPDGESRSVAAVEVDLAPATVDLAPLALHKAEAEPGRLVMRLAVTRGMVTAVERFELGVGATIVNGSAARESGKGWSQIDATASLGTGDPLAGAGELVLAMRSEDDRWRTTITSPDAGRLLQAYGYDHARGGRATLAGTVDLASEGLPFDGELVLERITLVRAPWLVKLVSAASITGMLNIGSERVGLDRVVATLVYRAPTLEMKQAVARGPELVANVTGTCNLPDDTLDLEGTLAPSYQAVSESAQAVPFLGPLLGHAAEGIIPAVSFTIRGPRTDPAVTVRPLSSLAPAVLRDWLRKLGL